METEQTVAGCDHRVLISALRTTECSSVMETQTVAGCDHRMLDRAIALLTFPAQKGVPTAAPSTAIHCLEWSMCASQCPCSSCWQVQEPEALTKPGQQPPDLSTSPANASISSSSGSGSSTLLLDDAFEYNQYNRLKADAGAAGHSSCIPLRFKCSTVAPHTLSCVFRGGRTQCSDSSEL
eukprot:1159774-Pelagomonas_calceolata.AAC.10